MKSSAKNIVLKSVDDIFQTEENRADAQRERVQEIPLDQLKPFRNHPFKVRDDQRMLDTVDSIREYGVLVPAIARPDPEGGYELISGHRRKRGCEMAGLQTMPVIIRDFRSRIRPSRWSRPSSSCWMCGRNSGRKIRNDKRTHGSDKRKRATEDTD